MTPEQTLLTRIVANNPPRRLLELLLKHGDLELGVLMDQGELDLLWELKPVKPDVVPSRFHKKMHDKAKPLIDGRWMFGRLNDQPHPRRPRQNRSDAETV